MTGSDEDAEGEEKVTEQVLQKMLEQETRTSRRQVLLKAIWKLSQQPQAASGCEPSPIVRNPNARGPRASPRSEDGAQLAAF
jgi:hypothetical protein